MRGNNRFKEIRPVYLQGTKACIIIFDVTDRDSFSSIPKFANELMDNNKNKIIPIMIIGNKIDLRDVVEDSISYDEAFTYTQELSSWLTLEVPYYETSAINDKGREAFEAIFRSLSLLY